MTNDNMPADGVGAQPSPKPREPDAHGQAALLLAEGILHGLIEVGVLTTRQASSIVRTAAEVKVEVADMIGESDGRLRQSLKLLDGIERSMAARGTDGG